MKEFYYYTFTFISNKMNLIIKFERILQLEGINKKQDDDMVSEMIDADAHTGACCCYGNNVLI